MRSVELKKFRLVNELTRVWSGPGEILIQNFSDRIYVGVIKGYQPLVFKTGDGSFFLFRHALFDVSGSLLAKEAYRGNSRKHQYHKQIVAKHVRTP